MSGPPNPPGLLLEKKSLGVRPPSGKRYLAANSPLSEFMFGPRLTGTLQAKSLLAFFRLVAQMSVWPLLPGRSLMNSITRPSGVNDRSRSIDGVFNTARFCGVLHGESLLFRVETQMSSLPPNEPGRLEVKNNVFSSLERTGA